MSFYFDIALEFLGSTLGVAFGLALVLGVLYWQYREYRAWRYGRQSYLFLKVGAPVVFILLGFVAAGVAGGIEGMEALGVFYLGMVIALALAPVSVALMGPLFKIPFKAALGISGSLFATLLVCFYGIGMLVGAGGNIFRTDLSYERQKFEQAQAFENPETARPAGPKCCNRRY